MKDSNGNGHLWRQLKIIVLLPLTIFLWMAGWALYWIGAKRMTARTVQKKTIKSFKKGTFERNLEESFSTANHGIDSKAEFQKQHNSCPLP